MTLIHTLSLGLALALAGTVGNARAEANVVGALVYYGSAEFADSNAGLTVGPYSTAAACEAALDAAIDNAVNNHNEEIESVSPCTPRWSFHGSLPELEAAPYELAVLAGSPGESLTVTRMLLDEVRRVRRAYRASEYEAALQAIAKASASK